jgi:hypothetical protein
MALFEFLITVGNHSDNHHCKEYLQIDNKLEKHRFVKRAFGNITISYLYYNSTDNFSYEDNDYFILLRGKLIPDVKGNLPNIQEVAFSLTNSNNRIVPELRGHFNIIKINKSYNDVGIINDYFGLKPVYYGRVKQEHIISSSLELVRHFEPDIDPAYLIEKLIFEHNLCENTIFKDFFTLQEASFLSLRNSQFTVQSYHNWYSFISSADSERKFSFSGYNQVFCEKINALANRESPNLITLTGGHDGRAVLSGFRKLKFPVETFSFGRPGSENTAIPEMIAKKLNFNHYSVYLRKEYELNYYKNALKTCKISDGELPFTQQTTFYSFGKVRLLSDSVFTGLLAGEVAGPIHLKTDYINPIYFEHVIGNLPFTKERLHQLTNDWFNLSESDYMNTFDKILANIHKKKQQLKEVTNSRNLHLVYLADMITWGFRKFYGYQMHLIRQFTENIPLLYDFDLVDMLINSDYNNTYKNSYKSLFARRNSRRLQIELINRNSDELAEIIIDRGYSPKLAMNRLLVPIKLYKYFLRRHKIKSGKHVPDFMGDKWTALLFDSEYFLSAMKNTLPCLLIKDEFMNGLIQDKVDNKPLTQEQIRIISLILFLTNYK